MKDPLRLFGLSETTVNSRPYKENDEMDNVVIDIQV